MLEYQQVTVDLVKAPKKILYNVHARTLLYNIIKGLHKSYKSVQSGKERERRKEGQSSGGG